MCAPHARDFSFQVAPSRLPEKKCRLLFNGFKALKGSLHPIDQIGIRREQTDQFGNLLWTGEYDAWGKLTAENKIYPNAHQPFRLQNQYFDQEMGLLYNFLHYYDPNCGRVVPNRRCG
nr:RHS repeat-associated core domain-containing protein [uncultured Kingella sp.]